MPIKTIRIKKAGGGTRLQKVEVLKSGKYKFVKNTRKTTSRKRSTFPSKKRRINIIKKTGLRIIRRRAATRKRSKGSDWSDW